MVAPFIDYTISISLSRLLICSPKKCFEKVLRIKIDDLYRVRSNSLQYRPKLISVTVTQKDVILLRYTIRLLTIFGR